MNKDIFLGTVRDFLLTYLPMQRVYSSNTVKSYRETLNLLLDFLSRSKNVKLIKLSFEHLTAPDIIAFLDWLEKERHCSISTRNNRLACIRSFLKYAGDKHPIIISIYSEVCRTSYKKPVISPVLEYMSEIAVKTVFMQPNLSLKIEHRNFFFMVLLYDTGARVQEILDLRLSDCFLEPKSPYVQLRGKGNKIRTVPLMTNTLKQFNAYLQVFHTHETECAVPLFYILRSGRKTKMSPDNAARFILKYGEEARKLCKDVPPKLHPHVFRHTRAMHLYQAGMPLMLVSEWLGHANLETTLIYASADTEMKRKAIEKATGENSPLRNLMPLWNGDDELLKKLYGLK